MLKIRRKKYEETIELTWSFISTMTIRELEKEFIDSNLGEVRSSDNNEYARTTITL